MIAAGDFTPLRIKIQLLSITVLSLLNSPVLAWH